MLLGDYTLKNSRRLDGLHESRVSTDAVARAVHVSKREPFFLITTKLPRTTLVPLSLVVLPRSCSCRWLLICALGTGQNKEFYTVTSEL